MEFSLFDGGEDDEHNGVGLVEVSNIFAEHGIVCQMLLWRTKNRPCLINTNIITLHPVHQAPSYGSILTLLAWFLQYLAYLSMLFIIEVLCTACSAEHLNNK